MAGSSVRSGVSVGADGSNDPAYTTSPAATSNAGSSPAAWVSGHGTNAAGCGSLTNPCLTLQYTHDNIVAAGGLIAVLDSSDYGPLVIRKAISIVDDGGLAGIAVASGDAIDIQAGLNDAVLIKGLHLDGLGAGANGIKFLSGGTLSVVNCTIENMTSTGVSIIPSSDGVIVVANSTIANNNGAGVYTSGDSSGSLTISLSNDKIINNGFSGGGYGVRLTGGQAAYQNATIDNTLISGNGTGLSVEASGSNEVSAFSVSNNILNNVSSVNVTSGGARLALEKTSIKSSYSGGIKNAGFIQTFGDNAIADNVTGSGLSPVSLK